jgi:hypothetical protein
MEASARRGAEKIKRTQDISQIQWVIFGGSGEHRVDRPQRRAPG